MDEVSTGRRPFLQAGLAALATGFVDPVQGESAAGGQQADERPVLVWQRTYDGADGNGVRLLEASDAGYLLVVNVGSSGLKLISVDGAGDVAWERTYGASSSDSGLYYDAVADADGGYVVAGNVAGSAELLRVDADGDEQWRVRPHGGGETSSSLHAVFETEEGFVGFGTRYGDAARAWAVWVNAEGDQRSDLTYPAEGSGDYSAYGAVRTDDDGYLVCGATVPDRDGADGDGWLLRLDSGGGESWTRTVGRNLGDDELFAITRAHDDGYVVSGQTWNGDEDSDTWVLGLHEDGGTRWASVTGDDDREWSNAVARRSDGYLSAGVDRTGDVSDAHILAMTENGDVAWERTLGGTDDDWLWDVVESGRDRYLFLGSTTSYAGSGQAAWLGELSTVDDGRLVVVTRQVHHLGDDSYSGTINSEFQVPAQGTTYETTVDLTESQATADDVTLRYNIRGAEKQNEVSINGTRVGTFDEAPADGSIGQREFAVDPAVLRAGENEFRVESEPEELVSGTDYDDFEFHDVYLAFEGLFDPPSASIATRADPENDLGVVLDGSESSDPDGEIERYEWDVDGDGQFEAEGETVSHTYDESGEYEVTLRVTDADGLQTTATTTVSVVSLNFGPGVEAVQTVANSYVSDSSVSADVSNPSLVPGRPTAVLFDFRSESAGELPENVDVAVRVSQVAESAGGAAGSAALDAETARRLTRGGDAVEAPADRILDGATDQSKPPVFELAPDVEALELTLRVAGTAVDSTRLEAGSAFDVAPRRDLTLGVVEVADGQGGSRFGRDPADAAGANGGGLRFDDDRFGNSREKFQAVVDEIESYVRRTYPVSSLTVEAMPSPFMAGANCGNYEQDFMQAHQALVEAFPDADFDATVAIPPDDYFEFHAPCDSNLESGTLGLELMETTPELSVGGVDFRIASQPLATSAAIARTAGGVFGSASPEQVTAATVAQEIGHHFSGWEAYPEALSMRMDGGSDVDRSHARTENDTNGINHGDEAALLSRCYDLSDGTFTLLQEGGTDGYWGENRSSPGQDEVYSLGSYMSYSGHDTWADAHIYQQLIDGDFSPTPGHRLHGPGSVTPIIRGTGRVTDDGEIEVHQLRRVEGRPQQSGDGSVTVTARDGTGSELGAATAPGQMVVLGHGTGSYTRDGRFTFAVPYPEETASVTVRHEEQDAEAEINPVERTLRAAIESVPDRGFDDDPEEVRETAFDLLERVKANMDANAYGNAGEALEDLEDELDDELVEYDPDGGQYGKAEILELVEEKQSRVESVSESAEAGGLASQLPGGVLPWAVGGAVGTLGLGTLGAGGYYLFRRSRRDDGDGDATSGGGGGGAGGGGSPGGTAPGQPGQQAGQRGGQGERARGGEPADRQSDASQGRDGS